MCKQSRQVTMVTNALSPNVSNWSDTLKILQRLLQDF